MSTIDRLSFGAIAEIRRLPSEPLFGYLLAVPVLTLVLFALYLNWKPTWRWFRRLRPELQAFTAIALAVSAAAIAKWFLWERIQDYWLTTTGIAGTWLIALTALFGERLRPGPELHLSLANSTATETSLDNTLAFVWHLRVSNDNRIAVATNVRVLLLSATKYDGKGAVVADSALRVPVPLVWREEKYQSFPTVGGPAVGFAIDCDLGYVREGDDRFQLSTRYPLRGFDRALAPGETFHLEAIATSDTADSGRLTLRVHWAGGGDRRGAAGLEIEVLPA